MPSILDQTLISQIHLYYHANMSKDNERTPRRILSYHNWVPIKIHISRENIHKESIMSFQTGIMTSQIRFTSKFSTKISKTNTKVERLIKTTQYIFVIFSLTL